MPSAKRPRGNGRRTAVYFAAASRAHGVPRLRANAGAGQRDLLAAGHLGVGVGLLARDRQP
eukprot:2796427-Lingulodinium_polyedra.AAC.1